jgi:multiple sugar transport system permease protein
MLSLPSSRPRATTDSRATFVARLSRISYRHRHWIGLLFILPWFISFVWFDVIPFVLNLYLSMTTYSVGPLNNGTWIGLKNYTTLLASDDRFISSLKNSATYTLFSVPLSLLTAFLIALLLNARVRGLRLFRTIFYIPSIVPVVASAYIFGFILSTNDGVLNAVLGLVGISPIRWLTSPLWVMRSLIIMSMWGFGTQMIIFLAGLQDIPQELYEAAEIDGAGSLRKMLQLTVPLMTPTIFFNLLVGMIGALQAFTTAFLLLGANGGPLQSGLLVMMHIYNSAFQYFGMAHAAALSVILFVIIFILTMIMVRMSDRWVFYSGGA